MTVKLQSPVDKGALFRCSVAGGGLRVTWKLPAKGKLGKKSYKAFQKAL